jgi:hypothetical protein
MRIRPGIWLMILLQYFFSGQAYGQSKCLKGYTSEQAVAQYELESRVKHKIGYLKWYCYFKNHKSSNTF